MANGERLRATRMFLVFVFCLVGLKLETQAQQTVYSADSLLATFDKASKVSLKGSEITFTDVVVDLKSSKVFFRSSLSDRVICELSPASANNSNHIALGRPLTISGKVRGRGLLGNVTLDNC